MYLKDGREIYECDQFPGYFIDANTGNFCDEQGNFIGGNIDDGDEPGKKGHAVMLDVPDYVYISKTGKQYYPKTTFAAQTPIRLEDAEAKGYKPSRGYQTFVANLYKKHMEKQRKEISKKNKTTKK